MCHPEAEHGLTPVLAVGAVVVHDGMLLMVRRGHEPGAGLWSVPGGRVEPGEGLVHAVEREVLEETSLHVVSSHLVGWVERRGPGWHFVICDFAAEMVDETEVPVAGDDADEAVFVPLDEVLSLPLVSGLGSWLIDHGLVEPTVTGGDAGPASG